ncbi:DAK2 domain-containing protein [Plantactinospora siamensis]|uniref:DAK2 domain-containing protein n=1 Tax=Plantactinospora siamensis TaxID=555372 RepID=A0ABV6NT13_9ACTN
MLETLDAAAVRRWCSGGLTALRRHQSEIDELNVYPVPDGDTGTNLVLTLTSAHQALIAEFDGRDGGRLSHGQALRLMARGALLGARGNSGVLVSQILRAFAEELGETTPARGRALAAALRAATSAAYAAVAEPVEGTLLTVAAAAAAAANRADSDDLRAVARAAAAAAAEALARTPEQLPALARAGVVDAGGRGLCLLLDALAETVTGNREPASAGERPGGSAARSGSVARRSSGSAAGRSAGSLPERPGGSAWPGGSVDRRAGGPVDGGPVDGRAGGSAWPGGSAGRGQAASPGTPEGPSGYEYEVQYLLRAAPAAVDRLRAVLGELGDSLTVAGDGGADGDPTWNVHVHVDDIGAAIEAGMAAGRPYRISVTRLTGADRDGPPRLAGAELPAGRDRAAVVVAAGDGLARLFAAEGATVVGGNPSIGELLAAIESTGAPRVVVLPNDPNARSVADAAAVEAHKHGVRVSVVPTRSPVQALAALAVRDPARRFDDDVIAMAESAGACRYGEVCHASREALTVAGRCRPGDVLGLVEGEVNLIGADLTQTCRALLDRMLGGGGELVTLLFGAGAPDGLDQELRAYLAGRWPFVEVQVYDGGQPNYPLLVGIE